MTQDWAKLAADLERLLKLRAIPFGMKLFERREEMEAIPRIRRPKAVHTLDQIVAQAARLGWTVGITSEDLVGAQCRAVVGLGLAKDEKWRSGQHMVGVWYGATARIPGDGRSNTRQPSLSIPCFAERRYGGVLDDEMLMALPPDDIPKAIAGMEALAKNGLR